MMTFWHAPIDWLGRTSWQAGVLVLLILAVQRLFRERLNPHWRYALWFLLVLKLTFPITPQTSFSLFNFARAGSHATEREPAVAGLRASSPMRIPHSQPEVRRPMESFLIAVRGGFSSASLRQAMTLVWFCGTVILTLRLTWQTVRFARNLRRAPPLSNPEILQEFEDCKRTIGVRRTVKLVKTDAVNTPAIFGYFSPRLLLPHGVVEDFSRRELRYVFLHELGHVKRGDMLMVWAAAVLGIVHWFNPLLWLGFKRMAGDRELACDELALRYTAEPERREYGNTIIRLLQNFATGATAVGAVGILENTSQVVHRISMIAHYKNRPRWSMTGTLIIGFLGLLTLTEARPLSEQPVSAEPGDGFQGTRTVPGARTNAPAESLPTSYSQTLEKIEQLQVELNELRQKYTEQHPAVVNLRQEIEQLTTRKAELEEQRRAEAAMTVFGQSYGFVPRQSSAANSNSTNSEGATPDQAAAREAFLRRYGLVPNQVSGSTSSGSNVDSTASAQAAAREAFTRRYGLMPSQLSGSNTAASDSDSQARAAFRKRYGLAGPAATGANQNQAPVPGKEFRTSFSDKNFPLSLSVDPDGQIRFGTEGKPVTLEQMRARLFEEVQRNPGLRLSIRADRTAPFGQIIKIMDAAKDAKIASVDASVREPQEEPSAPRRRP